VVVAEPAILPAAEPLMNMGSMLEPNSEYYSVVMMAHRLLKLNQSQGGRTKSARTCGILVGQLWAIRCTWRTNDSVKRRHTRLLILHFAFMRIVSLLIIRLPVPERRSNVWCPLGRNIMFRMSMQAHERTCAREL